MIQFILGGLAGIVIMCLLQINREKDRNVELQMLKIEEQRLIYANKSYKGIIDKQNKIINTMSEHLAVNHFCFKKEKCERSDKACEQCIKEYFERKVK